MNGILGAYSRWHSELVSYTLRVVIEEGGLRPNQKRMLELVEKIPDPTRVTVEGLKLYENSVVLEPDSGEDCRSFLGNLESLADLYNRAPDNPAGWRDPKPPEIDHPELGSHTISALKEVPSQHAGAVIGKHYSIGYMAIIAFAFCFYLGYDLFVRGVSGDASLVADAKGFGLQLLNASPGLFFLLFGAIGLGVTVWRLGEVHFSRHR